MNSSYKCSAGYAKKHLVRVAVTASVMLILSFGIYFLGIHIKGDNKNLLTLVAILGMLPAGKELVTLIMCIKAIKYICPNEIILKINEARNELLVRYDLYITAYDKSFPLYSLTSFDSSIVALSAESVFDEKGFAEHLKPLLSQNGLKAANIKVFTDLDKYLSRLDAFNTEEAKQSETDLKIIRLMENLSL